METKDNKESDLREEIANDVYSRIHHHNTSGRILGGLVILAAGVILLLKQLGTVIFPDWLFTWPVLVMAIGFYIGARHNFRLGGWIIVMLVGAAFFVENFIPDFHISTYIWPIVIIGIGTLMILPKRRYYWGHDKEYWKNYKWQMKSRYKYGQPYTTDSSSDDYIDSVSMFGGVHKVISSKDFKGGDVVNIFGGSEINLSQADIKGRVILEVTQIFGGTKIIIPSDWEVQPKMVAIFGNVEDKRNPALVKPNPEKVLVIEGTSIFAGVDILSY
jgi:predicted membrane protein